MIGARYYDNLDRCIDYAIRKKGFAINFVNTDLLHPISQNFSGETCLVYDCPEFDVQLSLNTNALYDYYSAYARPMPNTNVSCIPKLGIFQLHKIKANYSNAEQICIDEGGTLADITSRIYTEQLASLISSERIREAYVGLNRLQYPQEFLNSRGLPLNCVNYRAWAPGEPKPKDNANCVVLTSSMLWKVSTCDKELPFICELTPNGPYRPCLRHYSRS
ncbi:hypothetical protein O3M35_004916 [Rhynocoris fuscipes]|uniref:C-type lectin domain-containing protein n=1 Tax=Rhynocoris fuscipes TaxID=488301 RepID=A0AAW1DGM0_9HEMI